MTDTETLDSGTGKQKRKHTKHIIQSTMMLIVMFAISKGISLVQTFLIAREFGIGGEWDAYVAAARIPDTIVLLMSGGALNFAFIPVLSGLLAKGDTERAWKLASHVANTIFVSALFASILSFIFTPFIIHNVIAPAYSAETAALSISLMRTLLIGTMVFSISFIMTGILHSHHHFLLPALAPIINDIGILFGVLFLVSKFGVRGMVYGSILGAILHLLIQIPGLLRFRARWYMELGWNDPHLRQVIKLMLPRVAGLGVSNINVIIMTNLGSRLGEGATSAIDWGWRIMQIPQTLIGTAMGIVIFPTLSALSEVQDEQGKRTAMSGALRFIMIATIPSAIGMILIGQPLLSLLEGGAFDASSTMIVYGALRAFTLGIVVHSMMEIVARSFYADKDTVTPLMAAIVGAVINVILAYILTGLATGQSDITKVWGIAAANSIGVSVEVSILIWILRRCWRGIDENTIAVTTLKTIAASLIMGLAVIAVEVVFSMLGLSGRVLYTVALVGVQTIVGGIVFLIATLLLGIGEVRDMLKMIFRRGQNVDLDSVEPVG
ncbi:MAG: murein biosynthesis integral membrane protein MurJ [Anaerolineae bacterium]|nr:murein biosynthesis integral membrane protein MurJ [Anaerolineae bacterium]